MELQLLHSVLCVAFLILAFNIFTKKLKQPNNLPPSPLALPIIGHLHLLKHPLHRAFYALSRKHGPVLSLRFGSRPVLLVSSPSVAQECFTKNDIIFANRPSFFLYGKYINYNNTTLGAASYGDHWRNLRRLSTIEIFSSVRLNSFLAIRKDEVKILMRRLNRLSAAGGHGGYAKVEMRPMLSDLTFNIILRIMAGKRYYGEDVEGLEEGKQFREIMTEISEMAVATNIGDLIPMFQWVGYSKRVNKLVQLSKKMNAFFEMLIDEHESDEGRNTMVNHLLALQESQPEYYTDEIIKGLMLV